MENQENKEQLGAEQPESAPRTEADFKELAAKLNREKEGADAQKEKGLAAARRLSERDKRKEQEKSAPKPAQANMGKAPEHPQKKGSLLKRLGTFAAFLGGGVGGFAGGSYLRHQVNEKFGPETSPTPIKVPAVPEGADTVSDKRAEEPAIVVEDESEESIKEKVNRIAWQKMPAKTVEAVPAEPREEIVQEIRGASEAAPEQIKRGPQTEEEYQNMYRRDTDGSQFLVKRSPEDQKVWLERELVVLERQLADLQKEYGSDDITPRRKSLIEEKIKDNQEKTEKYFSEYKSL